MPELPEVETIRLGLERKLIGLTLKNVEILSPKSFQNVTGQPFDFAHGIRGMKVLKVWRKGKVLGIDLIGNQTSDVRRQTKNLIAEDRRLMTILIHLKMSGQLILVQSEECKVKSRFVGGHPTKDMLENLPNSHTRVVFEFSDPLRPRSEASGSHLFFNDQRRFGWVRIASSQELMANSLLAKMGSEPLEKEFTWEILKQNLLKHPKTPIKVALLDQTVVAGIGNIYACEACFLAKIDPRSKVSQLADKDMKSLHRAVQKALRDGIKYGGATKTHFVNADGKKGYFLDFANVYNRENQPCKKCKTKIKKIKLGGRGTFFCIKCQC